MLIFLLCLFSGFLLRLGFLLSCCSNLLCVLSVLFRSFFLDSISFRFCFCLLCLLLDTFSFLLSRNLFSLFACRLTAMLACLLLGGDLLTVLGSFLFAVQLCLVRPSLCFGRVFMVLVAALTGFVAALTRFVPPLCCFFV